MKNTKKFLWISFASLAVFCTAVIIFASMLIFERSSTAISGIGEIYMSAMARQMHQKFDVVVNLRLSEMEGIVERTPPQTVEYGEEMLEELAFSAQVRSFSYLGLYTKDGESETVYGTDVQYHDETTFRNVLKDSSLRVFSGASASGEKMLCLLLDASYPMKDGKTSSAMVAALPMAYLEDVLALDEESSLMSSFIIRRDGTYVVRDRSENDYYTFMRESVSAFNGTTPQQYVQQIQDAVNKNSDYSTIISVGGETRCLLCTHMPDSAWYLVSVMPFSALDGILENLDSQRLMIMLIAAVLVLAAVLLVFLLYYQMSRRQMEELTRAEREATKANKAKSEFLSSMSHDIRTPMNGIMGMTAIAMTNIEDPARVKDCLRKISLSGKHLLGLINDVLDMSKIESGKLTLNISQISLRDTMDSIVNIVQPQIKSKAQHFDIFIQKVLAEEVYCDSIRLNQILVNLLSNAVKFTPEGGTINVYLEQEESPRGAEYVRCHFRVRDTGIGMTPEFQKRIFDTFTRESSEQVNKTEGTGLGMAITKAIVDTMQGTIDLKSAPGQGSEFHITLDFERAQVKEADMILPAWRMLVVDNNQDLCLSAVASLKEIGIDAEWATDGETAVEMVKKRHNSGNGYEIVLLDWKMPGMDGVHTAKEMRKHLGEDVPILIISAYDWSDIEEEARAAGVQGFISKPLFKSNLYLGLKRYLDVDAQEEKESEEKTENTPDFSGKRILLAEDNDLNWEIAEDILSEAGFTLDRAENGQVCVDKFISSETGYYDVILMDIRMPVLNGYEAAKAIRALKRFDADIPIIAMTADAFSDDVQRCLACGMNEHVAKPIDIDQLTQLLKKYLK